ncbi:hypothetical protein AB9F39_37305, partial [Rhizobium leguminosarum]
KAESNSTSRFSAKPSISRLASSASSCFIFSTWRETKARLTSVRSRVCSGRQILHIASREELGLAETMPHLASFDLSERYSLLE